MLEAPVTSPQQVGHLLGTEGKFGEAIGRTSD
jgi:hypothetical protein